MNALVFFVNELIQLINKQIDTDISEDVSMQTLREMVIRYINDLILHDFQKLVTLLYKVDVNENKLKKILKKEAEKDAAEIIAHMIIEREIQKLETRKQFRG